MSTQTEEPILGAFGLEDEQAGPSGSNWLRAVRRAGDRRGNQRHRRWPYSFRIAVAIVGLLIFVAIFGPLFVGNPNTQNLADRLKGFGTPGHVLGTDGLGRDMLARLVDGTRPSLVTGVAPVAIAGVLGTTLGLWAALGGRIARTVIMRVLDIFYAFPAVLLAIGISASLGSGISNAIISLSVAFVPPIGRVVESEAGRFFGWDFMDAARASGAGRITIAVRQLLPNVLPALAVYCTTLVGLAIVYAAGLSFLGVGIAPPQPDWGLMISDLEQYIFSNPLLALVPAIAILIGSLAFNLLGDGLRDLLDVKREAR